MAKKAKVRVKGVVLLEAFLALLLMAIASYGMAVGNSVQFSQMAAGRESDSAKSYAELEAEYLKSLGFDAVVTNNKDDDDPSRTPRYPDGEQSSVDKASNARDMTKFLGDTLGAEWRSTATLGKTINNINGDSDNKIQNIVVSVYKKSDGDNASPRATVTLPLSSQGGDGKKLITNQYENGKLAMGWDGNKLHYFFNEIEVYPKTNIMLPIQYIETIGTPFPGPIRYEGVSSIGLGYWRDTGYYIVLYDKDNNKILSFHAN